MILGGLIGSSIQIVVVCLLLINHSSPTYLQQLECQMISLNLNMLQPITTHTNYKGLYRLDQQQKRIIKQISLSIIRHKQEIKNYQLNTSQPNHDQNNEPIAITNIINLYNKHPILDLSGYHIIPTNLQQQSQNILNLCSQGSKHQLNLIHQYNKYNKIVDQRINYNSLIHQSLIYHSITKQLYHTTIKMYTLLQSWANWLQTYYDPAIIVWKSMLVFLMSGVVVGILGVMVVGTCRVQCMGCFIHCGWIIGYLLGIFLILIVVAIGWTIILNNRICNDIYDWTIHNNTNHTINPKQINTDDIIKYCIQNGSNINKQFNLSYSLSPISSLSQVQYQLNHFNNQHVQQLSSHISNIESIMNNPSILPSIRIQLSTVLKKLNNLSNYNYPKSLQHPIGYCKLIQDQFVFANQNCKYAIYQSKHQPTATIGYKTCINLNTVDDQIVKRYDDQQIIQKCRPILRTKLKSYINRLLKYVKSFRHLFIPLNSSVHQYQTNHTNLLHSIQQVVTQQINPQYKSVYHQSGLLLQQYDSMMDCSFVKTHYQHIHVILCKEMRSDLLQVLMWLMVLLVMAILGGLVLCFSAARLIPNDNQQMFVFTNQQDQYSIKPSILI